MLLPQKFTGKTHYCSGLGLTISGAHLAYRPTPVWIHIGRLQGLVDAGIAIVSGFIMALVAIRYWPMAWPRDVTVNIYARRRQRSLPWHGAVLTAGMLAGSVVAWTIVTMREPRSPKHSTSEGGGSVRERPDNRGPTDQS